MIKVVLEGSSIHRNAYGSKVKVHYQGHVQQRELWGGQGHASHSSPYIHFGLGNHTLIDSLEVIWLGGHREVFYAINGNQTLYIKQNHGTYLTLGCQDSEADNYDPLALYNLSCFYSIAGCTNIEATNYNPWANTQDGTCMLSNTLSINMVENEIKVFPNPANSHITLNVPFQSKWDFLLYNSKGQSILEFPVSQTEETIIIDQLPKGLYYYSMISPTSPPVKGKIIKQ